MSVTKRNAIITAMAATAANAELLVQNSWVSNSPVAAPVCTGAFDFAVAYEVGKCQNVLSEEGLGTMQRIAEQVNSTHISILEYPPMSGCDENLGGYVLEWVQYDNKCNQGNSGQPDVTSTTVEATSTEAISPPIETSPVVNPGTGGGNARRRDVIVGPSVNNTIPDENISYKATTTNTTLAAVPLKSFNINLWTNPTGAEDWCGETAKGVENPATVASNYSIPIGECFSVPPQAAGDEPVYGKAYMALIGSMTNVLVKWYTDDTCDTGYTLYYDSMTFGSCYPMPNNRSTYTMSYVNAPYVATTTAAPSTTAVTRPASTSVKATTTATTRPTASASSSNLVGTPSSASSAAVSIGALACSMLMGVAALF